MDTRIFDQRRLRDGLGAFATGIAVVTTARPDGALSGVTVNSFTSVSLDPPLVSFCIADNSTAFESFMAAEHFVVNVLDEHQADLSRGFSRRGAEDKFLGVRHGVGVTGGPVLIDALSHFECERTAAIEAGDHHIILGRVIAMDVRAEGNPLLYYRGRYALIGPDGPIIGREAPA